jgi:hypothetical protein
MKSMDSPSIIRNSGFLLFSYDKGRTLNKYRCSNDAEKSSLKIFRSLSAEDMKEGMAECLYEFYKTLYSKDHLDDFLDTEIVSIPMMLDKLRYGSNDFIVKNTNLLVERIVHDIDFMEKSEKQSERECAKKALEKLDICIKSYRKSSIERKCQMILQGIFAVLLYVAAFYGSLLLFSHVKMLSDLKFSSQVTSEISASYVVFQNINISKIFSESALIISGFAGMIGIFLSGIIPVVEMIDLFMQEESISALDKVNNELGSCLSRRPRF